MAHAARWITGGAIASALAAALVLGAFPLPGGEPTATANQGKPLPEVMKRMQYYNKALGVDCNYCHVPNKFEVETPRKKTARWMQEHLVDRFEIKTTKEPIDCLTCHDGRARFLPSSQ